MRTFRQIFEDENVDHFASMPQDYLHMVTSHALKKNGYERTSTLGPNQSRWKEPKSVPEGHDDSMDRDLGEHGWSYHDEGDGIHGYQHPSGASIGMNVRYPGYLSLHTRGGEHDAN